MRHLSKNPARITEILEMFSVVWERNPSQRFGQLVSNLIGPGIQDVFPVDDEEWKRLLRTEILSERREGK